MLVGSMTGEPWRVVLVSALAINAILGFAYRTYRLSKGGPPGDVAGQAVLGVLLAGLALATANGSGWAHGAALVYGALFGIIVMPLWTLAVLLPMRPRGPDYAFTVVYSAALVAIVVAALSL